MCTWDIYIHLMLLLEGFTGDDGHLRLRHTEHSLRSLCTENPFLYRLYPLVPHFLDEEVSDELKAFKTSAAPWHLSGFLQRTGENTGILLQEDGSVELRFCTETRIEAHIGDSEKVHVFGGKHGSNVAMAVIGEPMYDALRFFGKKETHQSLMEDYLDLPGSTQELLKGVLCDREIRRSILHFMAFMAAEAAAGRNLMEDLAKEEAATRFNQCHASRLGCKVDMQVLRTIGLLDCEDYFLPQNKWPGWRLPSFAKFLLVVAIVYGISPWQNKWDSVASVLMDKVPGFYARTLSMYLPYLLGEAYLPLIEELLMTCQKSLHETSNVEDLLFYSLISYPLPQAFIERIADLLFEDSLPEYAIDEMKYVLASPNGKTFEHYIFKAYRRNIKDGNAAYHFAAAAILIQKYRDSGRDPLKEAEESIVLPFGVDDYLLGLSIASLIVWHGIGKRWNPVNTAYLTPSLIDQLRGELKHYDARYYSAAASILHDLVIGDYGFSVDLLDDPLIFQTAVNTLNHEIGWAWSEKILALIPWNCERELPENSSELCSRYAARMERELAGCEELTICPEVTYGILLNLGCWKTGMEKITAFRRVFDFYKDSGDIETIRRCRLLQEQLNKVDPREGIAHIGGEV